MKVAIVHDWLVTNAGAEKVLRALIDLYPEADIFSLVDFLTPKDRQVVVANKSVKTSFIQKLPFAKHHFRNYLPLFPLAIESFDLSKYDLIISSSWAVAKGIKKESHQLHISYCYTPIRYAWDLYDEYTYNLKQPKKFFVQSSLAYIRKFDIKTLTRVDYFIADSKFVAERIQRIYNRQSTVIYPPVAIERFSLYEQKEEFYLTVSRLVPYKKTRLIVEAFNKMPEKKLIVIGDGEEYQSIMKIAGDNILLLGYQKEDVLIKYMQKAKAFVYAAIEDFGIVILEAMSCGTPVIALDYGGTGETVENGVSGIYFKKQEVDAIINAVMLFETKKFDYKAISKNIKSYSYSRFRKEVSIFIDEKLHK